MLAASIATVTAFSAVNAHFINPVSLRWMWLTVVRTLVIAYYTARYTATLVRGGRVQQLVTIREAPAQ